tara:strand:- start:4672 stop:5190 length:519 start_codon:yes stop_codon:yes gene_type:complete
MINGSVSILNMILSKWDINRDDFINTIYLIDNKSNAKQQLYLDSETGKEERTIENEELFKKTLEYWTIIMALTTFVFGIEKVYNYMQHKKLRYRKSSIDDEDEESIAENSELEQSDRVKNMKKCCKLGFTYVLFGSGIVSFQYLFFEYVVFEYKPLSIEEIKYHAYCYLINE